MKKPNEGGDNWFKKLSLTPEMKEKHLLVDFNRDG